MRRISRINVNRKCSRNVPYVVFFVVVVVVFNFSCCHCYGSELHNLAERAERAKHIDGAKEIAEEKWNKLKRRKMVVCLAESTGAPTVAESIERYHCAFDSAERYATLCRFHSKRNSIRARIKCARTSWAREKEASDVFRCLFKCRTLSAAFD